MLTNANKKTDRRLVLVTGATRGLGFALVEKFAHLGHTVLGCGRAKDRIEKLWNTFGPPHDFATVDVSQEKEVGVWSNRILRRYGAPDLLINNAATINRKAPLWEIPAGAFSQLVDVNIKGVTSVIRHFVPSMIARQKGVIINISSGWGRSVSEGVAPYCASKWAIEGLTKALAEELPHGLAAIPLNPGIINTEMLKICFGPKAASAYPNAKDWAEKAVPFLLKLGPKHSGKSLTVPSIPTD